MAELRVLIEGYSRKENGVEAASSETVLIKENRINVIVDPGMNRKLLLDAMAKEHLAPKDINFVVLTHNHMDHMLLTGIFENAKVLDDSSVYTFDGKIYDHEGVVPGTDIKIIKSPGHDMFHCAVIVKTKQYGTVIIAADVFWWKDGNEPEFDRESLLKHEDPYVKNKEELLNSRKMILDAADYIVPGHGRMFKVQR